MNYSLDNSIVLEQQEVNFTKTLACDEKRKLYQKKKSTGLFLEESMVPGDT